MRSNSGESALEWKRYIRSLTGDARFADPAPEATLDEIESRLGVGLPHELRTLLRETDGVVGEYGIDLVWSAGRILKDNTEFRGGPDYAELYMPFDCLLFFADSGSGDQFAYSILAGRIRRNDIFLWDHENDSRTWVAHSLRHYLARWLSGELEL